MRRVGLGLGALAPAGNGEGGIRTLDGGFPPYSLSRRVPSATRPPLRELAMVALEAQQELLALEPSGVAAQRAAGAQDPVAGHDDGQRVGSQRVAGGAHRAR